MGRGAERRAVKPAMGARLGPAFAAVLVACSALAGARAAGQAVAASSAGAAASAGDPVLDVHNARHVRAVYLDLLGRTPDRDELELAQASQPDVLLRMLTGSREFWDHWYEDELYYFLLIDNARPAELAGDDVLPARLLAGKTNLLDAVRELATGSAFNRANPGNDTFVSVVFEQLLGLKVQSNVALLEAGKRMYDGQPSTLFGEAGSSQADVVAIVARQPGFALHIVERQYRRLLGSDPARADAERWAAELREHPERWPQLAAGWLVSPAYAQRLTTLRPKTDVQFLRSLFVDLTGEAPSPDQLQRLRGALGVLADAAPLRAVIARTLLDQQRDRLPKRGAIDGEAFIRDTFFRYLGRQPLPAELADFLLIYGQEDCEPATIVRAIVTHWEYQYY